MKLKEILHGCLFTDGDWIESKDQDPNGEIRLIQLADIGDGCFLDKSSRFINRETAKKLRCTFLQKNDILIARMPDPLGRACVFPLEENEKYVTAVDICIIRPNKNSNNRYLQYCLNSIDIRNSIEKQKTGTTRERITRKKLGELEIPLPPLPQQQKIANILDAADALRQNDKALIAKYDELTQVLFLDMFGDVRKNEKGWKQIVLGKLCDVGSSRRVFVDELVENGIPFYRGTEIGQMSLREDIKPTLFITELHYENLKRETGVPKIGDLLMPSICPDGRIFEVSNDKPFYFKDGRVLWIKVNHLKINSVYLKKHLKAIFAVDYAKIASGTTFAELKIFALKGLILHYPPLDLQNQFAERVAVIEEQKAIAQKSLEKSESLFNSLLQRAFKGEIG